MTFIRVGLCCLLAFAVLSFGAVEEWSQAVLEVGASVLLVVWAIRQYRLKPDHFSFPEELLPLFAFVFLTILQLVLGLTASRYETRVQLQLLLTYLIVIFLMAQTYSRMQSLRRLVWFLMVLGFCVSVFAILQHLTSNGNLYWVRPVRQGIPFGPYVNRNHFAGFAELIIPVGFVPLVLGKVRRERLFLATLFALAPIVALLLSASRGGIVSFAAQIVLVLVLLRVRRIHGKHILVGGVLVLCAVMAVSWIGVQQVLERFKTVETQEVSTGKRNTMRRDTWRLFLDHPILGTGLGTFQMVFPPYDSLYDARVVNHAHNDYLEAVAETGLVGGLCCSWFLVGLMMNSLKKWTEPRNSVGSALNLSGLVACSGFVVHSLVDFNLHVPSNALLFFVSAHLAMVRHNPATHIGEKLGQPARQEKQ